jgi:hypothetical protein
VRQLLLEDQYITGRSAGIAPLMAFLGSPTEEPRQVSPGFRRPLIPPHPHKSLRARTRGQPLSGALGRNPSTDTCRAPARPRSRGSPPLSGPFGAPPLGLLPPRPRYGRCALVSANQQIFRLYQWIEVFEGRNAPSGWQGKGR